MTDGSFDTHRFESFEEKRFRMRTCYYGSERSRMTHEGFDGGIMSKLPSPKRTRLPSNVAVGFELAATMMDGNGGVKARQLQDNGDGERKNVASASWPLEVRSIPEENCNVGNQVLHAQVVTQLEVPSTQGGDYRQHNVQDRNAPIEIIDVDAIPDVEENPEDVKPRDENATVERSSCEIIDVDALFDVEDESDGIAQDMRNAAEVMDSCGPGVVSDPGTDTEGRVVRAADMHPQENSTCQLAPIADTSNFLASTTSSLADVEGTGEDVHTSGLDNGAGVRRCGYIAQRM